MDRYSYNPAMGTQIHITDIEAAINYWRVQPGMIEGVSLGAPLRELAAVYGLMVYQKKTEIDPAQMSMKAKEAWMQWYLTTPDAPCIAICTTSQGDMVCKGCGRTFEEVQYWTAMTPPQKRAVWRRIVQEGTAWRFTRYKERAADVAKDDQPVSLDEDKKKVK